MDVFRKSGVSGYTLVELLFTVAILSILAAIAYPGFETQIQDRRLTAQVNRIYGAIQYARNEASARNSNIQICGSSDQTTCESNSDWSDGFIIIDLADNDVIQTYDALEGNNYLHNTPALTFSRTGTSTSNQINLCDSRGTNYAKGIRINGTGQARIGGTPLCN